MSITITVPNDDHVALRAMAKALEEIAVARGASKQYTQIGEMNIDTTQATAALEELCKQAEVDTTDQQFESLNLDETAEMALKVAAVMSDNDSTGTPWDERIHSASKALNADGTWRLRRKPADKTPEEWTAYVKWVEEDIHLVMSLQGETDEDDDKYSPDDLIVSVASASPDIEPYAVPEDEFITTTGFADEPSVTPEGDDFHVDAGEVTEQEVAAIPVPPLPVPPVPPVPNPATIAAIEELESGKGERFDVDEITMTFPQVMKFLTERHARISNEQVTEIITEMGLKSIMDLNTQPEHTGPFIARVKALLGE